MRTDINWIPFDNEEVTAGTGAAVGLSTSKITAMKGNNNLYLAKVLVSGFPVAWQESGATATASDKNIASGGDIIYLETLYAMEKFSAIGIGGSSILAVTYYKAG